MPLISNENVSVGDRVYDLTQGYGNVIDLTFGDITVRFDNGVRITFDKTGSYAGIRRLYWHNPIVVEPPKSGTLWGTLKTCLLAINRYLN